MNQRIDTHQHLLLPESFNYPWVKGFPQLQGSFGLDEYAAASAGCGILGTVFMEVDVAEDQSGDEARHFCKLAEYSSSGIVGVIASGRPERDGFASHLEAIIHPALKGIRRVLHVVPDDLSRDSRFRENVNLLGKRGLTFDICVRANQLELACELADACPNTRFILDHCGCPDIAGSSFQIWENGLREVAKRNHVAVKISGIPAYAAKERASADTLRPWVETTILLFGWERCLWGGDWPVCNLNGGLRDWCRAIDTILETETTENRAKLFTENARQIYKL